MPTVDRLEEFRTAAVDLRVFARRKSQRAADLWRANHEVFAAELFAEWSNLLGAGGELSVEAIQGLTKAAADYLAGQREASTRADADRVVQTRAIAATARATWVAAFSSSLAALAAIAALLVTLFKR